jgi:predicted N-acetyltransferase YhbS
MIKAVYSDKSNVVDILANSFENNKSVNYIIKQDVKRIQRIRKLMEYSFDFCFLFGDIYLSEDRKACALIVLPDKKRTTLRSIWLDIKLIFSCIGLSNVKKVIARETMIKKLQPKESMYYLWFIGVHPDHQHAGTGTTLLREIIEKSETDQRTICLETSTLKNLPWYEKLGFVIYNELDVGYRLFFLKKATLNK